MPRKSKTDADDALQASRLNAARWEAVLDTARDAIISTDAYGVIRLFNRSAEEIFGYGAEEALGQDVTLLMPDPYRGQHDNYLSEYRKTGQRRAIGTIRQAEGLHKSGRVFPIELAVSEARAGNERLFTAIVRDVTERSEAEELLRRERDFADRLIETAQVIVLVLDPDGCIVRFNSCMEAVCGYRLEEVKGRDWFEIFVPETELAEMRQLFGKIVARAPIRCHVGDILTRTGQLRQIEWHASTLRDGRDQVMAVLCVGQDISDRLRASAELRELQRVAQQRERLADVGAITAKIIHDVGNPLAALSLQTQLVRRRIERDGDAPLHSIGRTVDQILHEARRVEGLVREFMMFTGEQRLDLSAIEVPRFLRAIVDTWRPLANARRIQLALEVPRAVEQLRGDEEKLRRVFDNLIKNAVEAIDRGPGRVILRANLRSAEKLRIVVEDTGPGISDRIQVFRLFETTKLNGTGLGLAVAREIVLAHGGEIDFERRQPNGTVFQVDLPCNGPTM